MMSHLSANDITQPAAQLRSVARCSAFLQQGFLAEPQAVYRCCHIPTCQGAQRLLLQKARLVACACTHVPETIKPAPAAKFRVAHCSAGIAALYLALRLLRSTARKVPCMCTHGVEQHSEMSPASMRST